MDTTTLDSILAFLAAVVLPLGILGALAYLFGVDTSDIGTNGAPTPWIW